jgi:hypothetical protein
MVQEKDELVQQAVKCFLENLPEETDFFAGYQKREKEQGVKHLTNGDVEVMAAFLKKHGVNIDESDISRNKVAEEIADEFIRQRSESRESVEGNVGRKM